MGDKTSCPASDSVSASASGVPTPISNNPTSYKKRKVLTESAECFVTRLETTLKEANENYKANLFDVAIIGYTSILKEANEWWFRYESHCNRSHSSDDQEEREEQEDEDGDEEQEHEEKQKQEIEEEGESNDDSKVLKKKDTQIDKETSVTSKDTSMTKNDEVCDWRAIK